MDIHTPSTFLGAALVRKGFSMAAMKPRTGDGPLEVTKEGRGIVMRVPLEGGGGLVVEVSATEGGELGGRLQARAPGRGPEGRGPRGRGPRPPRPPTPAGGPGAGLARAPRRARRVLQGA